MTSDELKKLLKEYANKRWGHIHEYEDGFLDCVDLLWPLIEALEFYKNHADCKTTNIKCTCKFCVGDDNHRYVLTDLEQKLKGTE